MTTRPPPEDDPGLIERLDAGEPPRSPEEAQARAPYERLFERLRGLDDVSPPAGWEDRAVERWHRPARQRRLGLWLAATAAALAAVFLLKPCSAPAQPRLEVAVLGDPGHARRGPPAVGGLLHARARIDRAYVELRVYLGTKLLVRCPGQPCRSDASAVELDWKIVEPGSYQVVVLSGAAAIPPPGEGGIDRDLLEAKNAGAVLETRSVKVAP